MAAPCCHSVLSFLLGALIYSRVCLLRPRFLLRTIFAFFVRTLFFLAFFPPLVFLTLRRFFSLSTPPLSPAPHRRSVRCLRPVHEVREAPGLRNDRLHAARRRLRKASVPVGRPDSGVSRRLRKAPLGQNTALRQVPGLSKGDL